MSDHGRHQEFVKSLLMCLSVRIKINYDTYAKMRNSINLLTESEETISLPPILEAVQFPFIDECPDVKKPDELKHFLQLMRSSPLVLPITSCIQPVGTDVIPAIPSPSNILASRDPISMISLFQDVVAALQGNSGKHLSFKQNAQRYIVNQTVSAPSIISRGVSRATLIGAIFNSFSQSSSMDIKRIKMSCNSRFILPDGIITDIITPFTRSPGRNVQFFTDKPKFPSDPIIDCLCMEVNAILMECYMANINTKTKDLLHYDQLIPALVANYAGSASIKYSSSIIAIIHALSSFKTSYLALFSLSTLYQLICQHDAISALEILHSLDGREPNSLYTSRLLTAGVNALLRQLTSYMQTGTLKSSLPIINGSTPAHSPSFFPTGMLDNICEIAQLSSFCAQFGLIHEIPVEIKADAENPLASLVQVSSNLRAIKSSMTTKITDHLLIEHDFLGHVKFMFDIVLGRNSAYMREYVHLLASQDRHRALSTLITRNHNLLGRNYREEMLQRLICSSEGFAYELRDSPIAFLITEEMSLKIFVLSGYVTKLHQFDSLLDDNWVDMARSNSICNKIILLLWNMKTLLSRIIRYVYIECIGPACQDLIEEIESIEWITLLQLQNRITSIITDMTNKALFTNTEGMTSIMYNFFNCITKAVRLYQDLSVLNDKALIDRYETQFTKSIISEYDLIVNKIIRLKNEM